MLFFEFPEDARWSDKRDVVEFSVILRPYEGTVRIARRVFQGLLDQRPTPERCVEAFHLQHTRFEMIAERKLRRRQFTDDGNVEITGRGLRERTPPVGQGDLFIGTRDSYSTESRIRYDQKKFPMQQRPNPASGTLEARDRQWMISNNSYRPPRRAM